MSAFTASVTGNWNDTATWGGGSNYPGDTVSQEDTITINADVTVTLNVTTLTGSIGEMDISGNLLITTDFSTTGKFTDTIYVRDGGSFVFSGDGVRTFTWSLSANKTMIVYSGATFSMDATGSSSKYSFVMENNGGYGSIQLDPGSIVTMDGRSKTVRALTDAALVADTTTELHIADDADADWESGDKIGIVKDYQTYEHVILGTKTDDHWSFTASDAGSDIINSYASGTAVMNVTRSCVVRSMTEYSILYVYAAGDFSYIETDCVRFYQGRQEMTATGCSNHDSNSSKSAGNRGFSSMSSAGGKSKLIDYVAFVEAWSTSAHGIIWGSQGGQFEVEGGFSFAIFAASLGLVGYRTTMTTAKDVWLAGHLGVSGLTGIEAKFCAIHDCIIWGGKYSFNACNLTLYNCTTGYDPGENAAPPTNYTSYGSSLIFYNSTIGSDLSDVIYLQSGGIIANNSTIDGTKYKRYITQQKGTIITKDSGGYSDDGAYDELDPESDMYILWYPIDFYCAAGETPTLTLYAKLTAGSDIGGIEVVSWGSCLGLSITPSSGSLDADGEFTVNGNWTQKTINFTGSAVSSGLVSVWLKVKDGSSNETLGIDSIAVTGNS